MALKLKQKRLAEMMVMNPDWSKGKIAQEMGIDPSTIYRWKQNQEFKEYMHSLCQDRFKDMERLAVKKLQEHIKNGNWKATQYVLDNLGYKPEEKIDIHSSDININITGDVDD